MFWSRLWAACAGAGLRALYTRSAFLLLCAWLASASIVGFSAAVVLNLVAVALAWGTGRCAPDALRLPDPVGRFFTVALLLLTAACLAAPDAASLARLGYALFAGAAGADGLFPAAAATIVLLCLALGLPAARVWLWPQAPQRLGTQLAVAVACGALASLAALVLRDPRALLNAVL